LRALISEAGDLSVENIEGYGNIPLANQYNNCSRWVDNRYYTIKPLLKRLQKEYRHHFSQASSLESCLGLIISMKKVKTGV
jgi:hypothetical protein